LLRVHVRGMLPHCAPMHAAGRCRYAMGCVFGAYVSIIRRSPVCDGGTMMPIRSLVALQVVNQEHARRLHWRRRHARHATKHASCARSSASAAWQLASLRLLMRARRFIDEWKRAFSDAPWG
jgi:hypothetical protein